MDTQITSAPNPKDESLAAFKTWITDMTLRMAGKSDDSIVAVSQSTQSAQEL